MFGLCMPTGETYLLLKGGKQECVMLNDEIHPRKFIMEDKYVLGAIVYERDGRKTIVSMADYYAERGQELED